MLIGAKDWERERKRNLQRRAKGSGWRSREDLESTITAIWEERVSNGKVLQRSDDMKQMCLLIGGS